MLVKEAQPHPASPIPQPTTQGRAKARAGHLIHTQGLRLTRRLKKLAYLDFVALTATLLIALPFRQLSTILFLTKSDHSEGVASGGTTVQLLGNARCWPMGVSRQLTIIYHACTCAPSLIPTGQLIHAAKTIPDRQTRRHYSNEAADDHTQIPTAFSLHRLGPLGPPHTKPS